MEDFISRADTLALAAEEDGHCGALMVFASDIAALPAALDALEAAQKEIASLTAERDAEKRRADEWRAIAAGYQNDAIEEKRRTAAAINDIQQPDMCGVCKHNGQPDACRDAKHLAKIMNKDCFKWRDMCAENAPTGAESEGEHA